MFSKLTEKLEESKRFIAFVARHFYHDDCTYRASALAFTTLLAIVPLMSVGFTILSSLPVFHDLAGTAQDFIFENFVPASGKVMQSYLQLFTQQVAKLSMTGVAFLFIAALLVMFTIEQAMNTIWRANTSRNGISAFLLYWAILSLTPVMLGLSLAVSSYIFSIPFFKGHPSTQLLNIIPFLCSLIGFTFLYLVVPNCKVKFWHGATGALIAALLFESAKHGFAFYLKRYDTYQLLYGAFATIPIFFVWIYWVWVITLLGAEISYALSVHHQRRKGTPVDGFTHAMLWLRILWRAQQQGKSVTFNQLIDATNRPYAINPNEMIQTLIAIHCLQATKKGHFILSRDIHRLTLYELSQMLPFPLPNQAALDSADSEIEKAWQKPFQLIASQQKDVLGLPLQDFLEQ